MVIKGNLDIGVFVVRSNFHFITFAAKYTVYHAQHKPVVDMHEEWRSFFGILHLQVDKRQDIIVVYGIAEFIIPLFFDPEDLKFS